MGLSKANRRWLVDHLIESLDDDKSYEPNETTIRAIEEVKAGKTFKAASAEDLINQILG